MPQYAVLIYAGDSAHAPDAGDDDLGEANAHADELAATGAILVAYALTPRESAVSVRAGGASAGPFVTGAEIVAGFYVLEAPDLDAAVAIAATNPVVAGGGGVEVRPVHSGGVVRPR